ncbi:MAG: hypothetical protein J6U70_01525 [Bacteroidales bacterium]|nr:hypothetical protein [Bacteroidales bacterium]
MNKRIAVLLTVLLTAVAVQAQGPKGGHDPKGREEHKEQVLKAKIAFFTTEINLSVEEAQAFWPLYNAYWDELQTIHQNTRKAFRAIEALEELGDYTPEEMSRRLDAYLAHFEEEAKVHKAYRARFLEVLSVEKLAKMYVAEEHFRDQMIRMWKDKEERKERR